LLFFNNVIGNSQIDQISHSALWKNPCIASEGMLNQGTFCYLNAVK